MPGLRAGAGAPARDRPDAARTGVRYEAPDGLRERILAAIAAEPQRAAAADIGAAGAGGEPGELVAQAVPACTGARSRARSSRARRGDRAAARRSGPVALTDELVTGHVRSLMVDHLTDVAASDRHTVKPWFNGKLDFAPPVADLAKGNFPLTGGRLDYIGGRPVAALVYGRRAHVINVFVSTAAPAGPATLSHGGYNVVRWRSDDLTFWAVSDLNLRELEEFGAAFRERTQG